MNLIVCTVKERYTSYPDQSVSKKIKICKNYHINRGCNITFNNPFNLVIWIKQTCIFGEGYRALENPTDDEDEEEYMTRINTDKSFKTDQCICLTNPPNVLFCNCRHIPICEECDELINNNLGICPVCKTENTIKRTI